MLDRRGRPSSKEGHSIARKLTSQELRLMKGLYLTFIVALTSVAWAQDIHNHPREVHGVPGGVPEFCAQSTVTSVAGGAWSNPATWSTGKVPASDDRVAI